jgi:hypothetical protein
MFSRAAPFFAIITPVTAMAFGFAATVLLYRDDPRPKRDLAAEAQARRPLVLETVKRSVASPPTLISSGIEGASFDNPGGARTVGLAPETAPPSKQRLAPHVAKRLAEPADIIRAEPPGRPKARQMVTVKVNGKVRVVQRWEEPAR